MVLESIFWRAQIIRCWLPDFKGEELGCKLAHMCKRWVVHKILGEMVQTMRMDKVLRRRHELEKGAGVYAVEHLPSGKLYIGFSKHLARRGKEHALSIKRGDHANSRIRTLGNQLQDFVFHVVQRTTPTRMFTVEGALIRKHQAFETGLNLSPRACGGQHNAEGDKKISEGVSKAFALKKDGVVYEGKNLYKFAQAHGIAQSTLYRVLSGQRRQARGWTLPDKELPSTSVRGPDGSIHNIEYNKIIAFAREHGLTRQELRGVLKSKNVLHQGWSHVDAAFTKEERQKLDPTTGKLVPQTVTYNREKAYRLEKDGVIYEGTNCQKLADAHAIAPCAIHALLDGRIKWFKGWSLPGYVGVVRYIKAPDGRVHKIVHRGLLGFAQTHGLTEDGIRSVFKRGFAHRGWTRSSEDEYEDQPSLPGN